MRTPIWCEFMVGFFFSEKLENREDDKCQYKKKSAEQKLHFHRPWDVSEEKQPGVAEGPQSSGSGSPGLESWFFHCISLGLSFLIMKIGVYVN